MKYHNANSNDSTDPVLQWVTFRLEQETYGINVMQVQEVLRYTELAPVPGAPKHVLGIINLRGNVVTVIDTHQKLGLATPLITDQTRIIIVELDQQVVGMLVDRLAEVVSLHRSEITTVPSVGQEETSKYFQGVCNREETLLILIDLNKLLQNNEDKRTEGMASIR